MGSDKINEAELSCEKASADKSDPEISAPKKADRKSGANTKLFFSKILAGFVIGAGAIIPGLSGGILAVSMGLYQPAIEAIAGFFKAPKKNFKFLFPLAIGGVIGLLLFMFLIEKLFANYQTAIICLFMGLVFGSIPSFLKEANGDEPFKKSSLLYAFIGFCFAFALVLLGLLTGNYAQPDASLASPQYAGTVQGAVNAIEFINANSVKITPLLSLVCGAIVIFGVVLPGISTSFILMNMGVYEEFLQIFTGFFSDIPGNLTLALFALLGMIVVIVPMLLLVRKVLNRFHRQSYYVLFGILISTVVGCIIQEIQRNMRGVSFVQILIYILLLAAGIIGSYFMDRAMKNLELKSEDEKPAAVVKQ